MPFRSLLFFLLAILSGLLFFLHFDRLTCIVPGWHTAVYRSSGWLQAIFPVLLFTVSLLYWKLSKKGISTPRVLFEWHLLFTILPYLYANFGLAMFSPGFFSNDFNRWILAIESAYWCQWLLMIVQVFFILLLIRRLFSKPPLSPLPVNS
jgi:uncharacterized membrane protein